jgi:hypothetical protein
MRGSAGSSISLPITTIGRERLRRQTQKLPRSTRRIDFRITAH